MLFVVRGLGTSYNPEPSKEDHLRTLAVIKMALDRLPHVAAKLFQVIGFGKDRFPRALGRYSPLPALLRREK
jgi:hypothetical protein